MDSENPISSSSSEYDHKDVLPIKPIEIIGYLIIFIVAALASSAGTGGGPVMTTILVCLFFFETHAAIPLAQVIVFGGTLAATSFNVSSRYPTRDRPLIFYQFMMLIQAPLLFGTAFGALVNTILPSWLIEILLTSVLIYTCITSFKKGIMLHQKESKHKSAEQILEGEKSEKQPLCQPEMAHNNHRYLESYDTARLDPITKAEKRWVPIKEVLIIFGIWIVVVLYTLMRGASVPSIIGIEKCSPAYFGLSAGFVCVQFVIFLITLKIVIKDTETKEALCYNWDECDIKWTKKNAIFFGVICIGVGFLAGMVGVAGGLILMPIMLHYGMRPEQAAATSSLMMLFTASTAILQFVTSNLVHPQYGVVVILISFAGSFTGIMVVKKVIERLQRPSIIVFILGFIMAISAVIIPTYGTIKFIDSLENGSGNLGFRSLCG
jgi:uncharacterized membrane protein YfcA